MDQNPIGLKGIEFVEFTSDQPQQLQNLFLAFGFSLTHQHKNKKIDYFFQNDIHFLLNYETQSFAKNFSQIHGPSICSMGWRVLDSKKAHEEALKRGARAAQGDYDLPAIYGIGESLIYFIDPASNFEKLGFIQHAHPILKENKGFLTVDHLTNNVPQGTMSKWADFYKKIFNFSEVRYFDIRGAKTGLTSYALRSPCGTFSIPINEGTEEKSQINEYLREYNGAGIQHLAFLTSDILTSLKKLKGTSIQTLEIDDEYYSEVFDRVPNVTEDHRAIRDMNVLVDGDEEGYLLQIFTKNLIGPIFIEIIQRKNHHSFGEGNFGALFRSLERDQEKRGVL